MGRVYRVHDTKLNEEVALKLIRPEFGADKRTVERFHNEIKLARKIRHKNVCGTHDLHEDGRTLYLTMEYVRGEDLKSFIKRSKILSVGTSVAIARQVAEGLAEAHKLGIVHRDLKPGNIMVDKEGQAKIMDFGIARAMREKGITGAGAIIGTPEYMSPEQVEGKEADPRADIYALGVILFEMVTGQTPFEGETPLSIAHKHRYEPPPDPRSLNPQVPAEVGRLILRCMEKPLEKRYQTTGELLADLEAIEASMPTTERAAGRAASRTRPRTSRDITVRFTMKRWLVPAAAVVGLAGAFLLWWLAFRPKPTPGPAASTMPAIAVLDFENLSKDESLDFWRGGLPELLITGLYQSRFINVLTRDRADAILKKVGLAGSAKYTSDDLARIAGEGRITQIITGSYLRAGSKILITLTLQDPRTQKTIERMNVECRDQDEILAKANDLVLQVKRDLNLSGEQLSADALVYRKLDAATTSSAEAYRFYSEGMNFIRQGKFEESIPMIERALALDPEFAMALRLLGVAYGGSGRRAEARTCYEKAMALRDRIPEKERLLIEAMFYTNRGEKYFDRAIGAYTSYLGLYPEDYVWHSNLGSIYFQIGEWDKAQELFEKSRMGDPANIIPVINSALASEAKGEYGRARDIQEEYLRLHPDNITVRRYLAGNLVLMREFDRALAEVEKAEALEPEAAQDILIRGDIALYRGDLALAEREYRTLVERKELQARRPAAAKLNMLAVLQGKLSWLRDRLTRAGEKPGGAKEPPPVFLERYLSAWYLLRTGDAGASLDAFRKILDEGIKTENPQAQREALLGEGMACLALERTGEALRTAEELRKVIEAGLYKKSIQLYEYLVGCIELKRNNPKSAVASLERAVSLMPYEHDEMPFGPQALWLDALARAYLEAGQEARALEAYQRITGLTIGRIAWGDIYAKSFYQMGRILEKRGDRTEAATNFRKFLELWKDADPGLPEVDDARKRLAALKGS